ncbi:MAG: hypothetical protein M2R45_01326 [Verrucomicrobia subdivision 3 bacterium]|nr:hypothetical protein [Limisphaerales bacterium]MCS1415192.1 hypothetical protein [Limisphaerales bacterium]
MDRALAGDFPNEFDLWVAHPLSESQVLSICLGVHQGWFLLILSGFLAGFLLLPWFLGLFLLAIPDF